MLRFTYRLGDDIHTVDLMPAPDGGWIAEIGGVRYHVSADALPDGGAALVVDGKKHRAYAASEGDQRYVWVDGEATTLEVVRQLGRGRSRTGGEAGGRLTAQMPGLVRAVLVAVGDSVTRGQTLAILEAMKMELRVLAPGDGRVRALHIAVGQLVERGALLIEVES
jgi:3-methylcrotonyl-CoA carboxylase alpha subunit